MKKWWLIILLLTPLVIRAQIITTWAGNGTATNTGDGGLAINAGINYPIGGVFDKDGNYYCAEGIVGHRIRKISSSGIITTVAGTGMAGFSGDGGLATLAQLNNPQAVTVDSVGNLFIADASNNRIRKVDVSTGIISTIAGNGTGGYNGDGILAINAEVYDPLNLCFDKKGNLFIADEGNVRVRKIGTSGIVTTVTGTGTPGYTIVGGHADTTKIVAAYGLCTDKFDNIYIADGYSRVFKVDTNGIITTYAGNGVAGYSGDNGIAINAEIVPFDIAFDKYNNLYIGDGEGYYRVQVVNTLGIISTVVGNGIEGYSGDGGPADSAEINWSDGVVTDSCGNLYVADLNNMRIRKVTFNPSCLPEKVNEITPQNISIYPNPTIGKINIDNLQSATSYQLLNIVGALMQQGTLKEGNNSISVQALPPGMYLLALTDGEGKRAVSKIVKE